jgi:hypothetical protein
MASSAPRWWFVAANIERLCAGLKLYSMLIIAVRIAGRRCPLTIGCSTHKRASLENCRPAPFPRQSDASATPRDVTAQPSSIGYLAKIASIRVKAFSAAASGVIPLRMMSAQAVLQTCVFWTSA